MVNVVRFVCECDVRAAAAADDCRTEWKSINTYDCIHEKSTAAGNSLNWRKTSKRNRTNHKLFIKWTNKYFYFSLFFCQPNTENPNLYEIHVNFEISKLIENQQRFLKSANNFHAYRNGTNTFCSEKYISFELTFNDWVFLRWENEVNSTNNEIYTMKKKAKLMRFWHPFFPFVEIVTQRSLWKTCKYGLSC